MDRGDMTAQLRSPKREDYPELAGYSRDDIYADSLGCGALYLAVRMVRTMALRPGDIVLDLGCGQGAAAIFLARHVAVQVIAVDLWTPATLLSQRLTARGHRHQVLPLNLDTTRPLPFAQDYFDAIFCLNSLFFFGGSVEVLENLLGHLRPGGRFAVGMEAFNEEFTPAQQRDPPEVYNYRLSPPRDHLDLWEGHYSRMHSPGWWEALFRRTGAVDVLHCHELEDAVILYEDMARYYIERGLHQEDVPWLLAQLAYGRTHRPYPTLFTLTARKR